MAQVSAVSAMGFAEGPSHTNWKKVASIVLWWFVGFFCVLGATYALLAQGVPCHLVSFCISFPLSCSSACASCFLFMFSHLFIFILFACCLGFLSPFGLLVPSPDFFPQYFHVHGFPPAAPLFMCCATVCTCSQTAVLLYTTLVLSYCSIPIHSI